MTDDQTTPPVADPAAANHGTPATPATTDQPGQDPVAALDDLIAKAKAKRQKISESSQGAADPATPSDATAEQAPTEPAGPTPEEIQAQQMAELAAKEQQSQAQDQQMLEQHQEKMQELEHTPQYQARKSQDEEAAKEQAEQQAAQQGHVIHQIEDTKV